jgi:sialate O-acetylesterase
MKIKVFFVFLVSCFCANANVSLPKIFANDMVLQRNKLIPVWGWADANEKIEIKFNKQRKTTKADNNGKWTIRLDSENAGGPYELIIKGKNIISIKNVLVGDVWICSGQSNMEFKVRESENAEKEIYDANFPLIREFAISRDLNSVPLNDVKSGKWEVCNRSTVGNFTAVGFFFAKKIYSELKIPIGLIHTSWGGTVSETWTSREGFETSDEFKEMISRMPMVNLDSISKAAIKLTTNRVEKIQGYKINSDNITAYKELTLDDSNWPQINLPEVWETQSLGEFDGVVWFRKTIILSAMEVGKPGTIELSKIDDEDISYINGIEIGRNTTWDLKRKYTIPEGILKEGPNVISIRVVDNNGAGGIYGESDDFKLKIGDKVIPLKGNWKYRVESVRSDIGPNTFPTLLYNAMINPIVPYAIQGVLWYQGESNSSRAQQYKKAFPLLITDWRNKWNQGDFPFYFVQISSFNASNGNSNNGSMWAELREAQSETLKLYNTGMCITTDIGNPKDIHPANKQDVGIRLAAIALRNVYKQNIICSGPTYESYQIQGNKIIVSFRNLGSGLYTPDKYGYVKGFEIAGPDKMFYYANAKIVNNKVVISNDKVVEPIAVRYGWADDASDNNLYNKEGFPADSFRTDNWKNITDNIKYNIIKLDK